MSNDIKPTNHIGSATGFSVAAFKATYDGITKRAGRPPDVAVCGSDAMAEDVRAACQELGLDLHVIADKEISPKRVWLTSLSSMDLIPGACGN